MRYPDKCELQDIGENKTAYIRFLHAIAAEPPVNIDLYVNNRLIVQNFKFQEFTEYVTATPGTYIINAYSTGTKDNPLISSQIHLNPDEIATAALTGISTDASLEVFSDYIPEEVHNKIAQMRFINIASDKTPVNIYIDNKPVVYDLEFGESTRYLSFSPGKHTMIVETSNTRQVVVRHPELILKGGKNYATFVVGFASKDPRIEVLIPLEGSTYLG